MCRFKEKIRDFILRFFDVRESGMDLRVLKLIMEDGKVFKKSIGEEKYCSFY